MCWRQPRTHNLIDHSEIHELVSDIVAPDLGDFTALDRSVYAKRIDSDIALLLKLDFWKGAECSFSWGVSLSYVPDNLSLPLRFHRTLMSVRRDLWEDRFSMAFPEHAYATRLHGAKVARSEIERAWKWTRPQARDWWASAMTLADVLVHAERQARAERSGEVHHFPAPRVVQLLSLGKLGYAADAGALVEGAAYDDVERKALLAALERITRET
jgi:hypothetical protein